jgi:hypothetical protein
LYFNCPWLSNSGFFESNAFCTHSLVYHLKTRNPSILFLFFLKRFTEGMVHTINFQIQLFVSIFSEKNDSGSRFILKNRKSENLNPKFITFWVSLPQPVMWLEVTCFINFSLKSKWSVKTLKLSWGSVY